MQSRDMPAKNDGRITLRLPTDLVARLAPIETKHRYTPADIARDLLEAAADFYEKHGYFVLPLQVAPSKEFIKAVKETKSFLDTSDANLPQVAGKDAETKQTPKPRKSA